MQALTNLNGKEIMNSEGRGTGKSYRLNWASFGVIHRPKPHLSEAECVHPCASMHACTVASECAPTPPISLRVSPPPWRVFSRVVARTLFVG